MNFSFGKDCSNDIYMGDDCFTETHIASKPSEVFQSTALAKIEQKQQSGKNVIVIDTDGPLSKSTVDKLAKMISSTKQKPVGEEASKQEQIEDFLKKYKTSFNDVPVKDMRHIIPLILMEVYMEKYGQYTKKVKGLWEKRPDDWPEKVPFVDPNNRLKNEGEEKKNVKPKKELLGQMLTYLVDRYTKMKSGAESSDSYLLHANDPLLCFPNQPIMYDDLCQYELNLVETNDSELRAAEQSVSDQSLSMSTEHNSGYSSMTGYSLVFHHGVKSSLSSVTNDGSLIPSSLSTMEDPLSGGVNEEHGELMADGATSCLGVQWTKQPDLDARPEQVVDNEEDWNPLEEISERTRRKLGYIKMKALVPKATQDQLEDIHGHLKNSLVAVLDDDAKLELLGKWYLLEKCIDTAKFQQPFKCSNMIQDQLDELNRKIVLSLDFMGSNTVKSKSMDLPIPAEDPQQINSLLNIRPRPGPAGGIVPFPTGNQLEVRYLTTKQSASNNGCSVSMLSDNHKPIQLAQEDGEAQKSDKPEDNLVTGAESLPFFLNDDDLTDVLSQLNQQEPFWTIQQLNQQELSWPIQESAPVTQSTSQLAGKFEMPVASSQHVMTSVSVQPWVNVNPPMMTSTPMPRSVLSSPAVGHSQLPPSSSVGSPSSVFAEECINRLSLSVNPDPSPPPVQKANPCPPVQPLLDQLLGKPRAPGRPGGKRCYRNDEDDELGEIMSGPSKPAKVPAYNMMIPLVVEEMSNNLDKPFLRTLKKKTRTTP